MTIELLEDDSKFSKIDSLKIKISFLLGYSIKKFLTIFFPYLIFGVNSFFFYNFGRENILSLIACSIFFCICIIFYYLTMRVLNGSKND